MSTEMRDLRTGRLKARRRHLELKIEEYEHEIRKIDRELGQLEEDRDV